MPSIVLDNFKKETTEFVESDGKNNLHAQIDAIPVIAPRGDIFNSPRIDTTYGINYPLYGWNNSFNIIDLTYLVPSISWDLIVNSYRRYLVDKKGNIAVIDPLNNSVSGSKQTPQQTNTTNNCICLFNNNLVLTSLDYNDRFYYIFYSLLGSWSTVTFPTGRYVYYPIVFNNNLFLAQSNPAGGQLVSRYNTSFNLVGSLVVNTNGYICGLTNYNNQYLAIFIKEWLKSYMILWNGDVNSSSSDRYNLPSRLISACSSGGYLFVLLEERYGFGLYYFTGNNFKLLHKFTKFEIDEPEQIQMKNIMVDWNGYLMINTGKRIIFYNYQSDEIFGVGQNNAMVFPPSTNYFINYNSYDTFYTKQRKWGIFYPANANGLVVSFSINQEISNYMGRSFFYRSNWIVLGKRIKINNIKLYYTSEEKPNYYLNVRIGYIDEKTGGSLQTKDYSFLQSQLPASYKEFQVNIECTKFFVMIWTDPNINTASKSIKRAIIDYDILE